MGVTAEFGPNIGDTITQLLGRTAALTAENRIHRSDQGRLLAALGLDPETDTIEDAIAVSEALVSLL